MAIRIGTTHKEHVCDACLGTIPVDIKAKYHKPRFQKDKSTGILTLRPWRFWHLDCPTATEQVRKPSQSEADQSKRDLVRVTREVRDQSDTLWADAIALGARTGSSLGGRYVHLVMQDRARKGSKGLCGRKIDHVDGAGPRDGQRLTCNDCRRMLLEQNTKSAEAHEEPREQVVAQVAPQTQAEPVKQAVFAASAYVTLDSRTMSTDALSALIIQLNAQNVSITVI